MPVLSRVCFESYNEPGALYETLKRRGMDLVTVTDHDSVGAAGELARHPDFFLSEEVTCTMPSGGGMHAGVYGIRERDHAELMRRRTDIESLLAYALEHKLFVTVNHLYSSLTGRRTGEDFEIFARDFHGVETLNGQILKRSNGLAHEFAVRFGKPAIGGSDAHTLRSAARTWTEVPGARTAEEFLAGVRRGFGQPRGESGDYWKLTGAVLGIGTSLVRREPWMALLAGLFAVAPAVTLGNYLREIAFSYYWGAKHRARGPAAIPAVIPAEAAV